MGQWVYSNLYSQGSSLTAGRHGRPEKISCELPAVSKFVCLVILLTLTVPVTTIDALRHFETG